MTFDNEFGQRRRARHKIQVVEEAYIIKNFQDGLGHPSIGQMNISLPGSFQSSLAYRSVLSLWHCSHMNEPPEQDEWVGRRR